MAAADVSPVNGAGFPGRQPAIGHRARAGAAHVRSSPFESMTPPFGGVNLLNTDPPPIDGGRLRGSHSVFAPTATLVVPPIEEFGKRTPLLFHGRY